MKTLLKVLILVALAPIARIVARLIRPVFGFLPLDRAVVVAVLGHVGTLYAGGTPTYAAVGSTSLEDVRDHANDVVEVLNALRTHYGIAVDDTDLAKLFDAVTPLLAAATP